MHVNSIRQENENLRSRLYNWKFKQAKRYLKGETESVKRIVRSLAVLFGDCGWLEEGKLEMTVGAVVDSLIGYEEEDSEYEEGKEG